MKYYNLDIAHTKKVLKTFDNRKHRILFEGRNTVFFSDRKVFENLSLLYYNGSKKNMFDIIEHLFKSKYQYLLRDLGGQKAPFPEQALASAPLNLRPAAPPCQAS